MEDQKKIEERNREAMKSRAEKMILIEKLRSMGFSDQEIDYNFSQSDKNLDMEDSDKHIFQKDSY